jgi:hypothetical protein
LACGYAFQRRWILSCGLFRGSDFAHMLASNTWRIA